MYTRMKIINSHYIPLPEPRWLIVTPQGVIYEPKIQLNIDMLYWLHISFVPQSYKIFYRLLYFNSEITYYLMKRDAI